MIIPISRQTPYCDIVETDMVDMDMTDMDNGHWTWKTRTGVNVFPSEYILRVNIFQR